MRDGKSEGLKIDEKRNLPEKWRFGEAGTLLLDGQASVLLFFMIISVHIPRTAGSSFRELLQERFGDRLAYHYYHFLDAAMQPVDEPGPGAECLHGHFPATLHLSRYPNAALITWVRRPLDRIISEYKFLKQSPDEGNALSRLIQDGATLVEFAEHVGNRNRMCAYLDGQPLSRFAFVGISEQFDLELDRLERCTGLRLRKYHAVNQSWRSTRVEMSDAEREFILSINEADVRLYEHCLGAAFSW